MNNNFLIAYFLSLAISCGWFLMERRRGRTIVPSIVLAVDMTLGVVLVRLAARNVPGLCSSKHCVAQFVQIFDFSSYMLVALMAITFVLLFLAVKKKG
ncbi:hypothetical protein [Xanthomonas tesorieronis]|uniref:hypothetical protein n=1 Tax=Xanthomonas tesorieronis TaxID=3160839 RepID=UPI00351697E1